MLQIAAEPAALATLRRYITAAAADADPELVNDLVLAANELATNTMVHGYRGAPGTIEVEALLDGATLVVWLRDAAPAFDPTAAPTPDINLPLHRRKPGGMGIHLARHLTDSLAYRLTPDGRNETRLAKRVRM